MTTNKLLPPLCVEEKLFMFASHDRMFGTSKTGSWLIETKESVLAIDAEEKSIFALPLLEISEPDFSDHLALAATMFPEHRQAIDAFPRKQLLVRALEYDTSDYWPEKAITWIECSPEVYVSMAGLLHEVSTRASASQALRHRAMRLRATLLKQK